MTHALHLSAQDAYHRLRAAERERDEAVAKLDKAEAMKDRDETRRLLYMVLFDGLKTDRWYVTAGTLTNALVHHNLRLDVDEVMRRLTEIHEDQNVDENEDWVRSLIERLGAEPGA